MAIDFPDSPTVGDQYTVNGKTYQWDGTVWGVYGTFSRDFTASDTAPLNVADGHIWYRSDQSQTLIRYDGTWVEVGSAGGFDSSSTSFPSSLDSGTGFAAVEALQAKVGVDGSAVTTSIDYQLNTGYRYHSTVYYTSDGTFTKASYPWLRAIRVKCQAGGGGAGSGDAMGVGEAVVSGSGGGGSYTESFITDISSLASSVTVTVGSGGAGAIGGAGNGAGGSFGGDSEFGAGTAYEVSAGGGNPGGRGFENNLNSGAQGAAARRVGTGDLVVTGGAGGHGMFIGTGSGAQTSAFGGAGGDSMLGKGGRGGQEVNTDATETGQNGTNFGGGGGGGAGSAATTAVNGPSGGNGADGIVIVELYA